MDHETETASRTGRRVTRRQKAAAVIGTSAVLAAFGIAQLQGASAEPVDSNIAAVCALGTSTVDVTVPLTVDDKIDPVTEGGHSTLETRTGLPSLPVEVTINKLVVTTPIPTQIASTDAVTFGPGNVTPSYEVIGSDLVVTFTGPVSSSAIQVPSVTAEQTVASGSGAATIDWKPFSKIDADTNYGMATCTPNDPNQIVNSTTINATPPPTEPAPPTTEPAPTEPTTPPTTEPAPTEPTTPPTTQPPTTQPPTTQPPSTPPTTQPPSKPGPAIPGVPNLPVPVPPLPAPPAVPPAPSAPSIPSVPVPPLPAPGEPCPVTGLPPLPGTACPTVPAVPSPHIDIDADIDIDLTLGL